MQLEGSTHNDRSYATITIDPAPLYGEASLGVNLTQVYANPVTMAMVPLDPAVQYTVSMKVADDSIKFAFNNATFYLSTGKPGASSGGKKVAAGTIAGAVIGCLAGLALIGALVWWFMRHRRSRNVRGAGHIESSDDEGQSKRTGIMGSMRFGKGGDAKMSKAYEAKQFNMYVWPWATSRGSRGFRSDTAVMEAARHLSTTTPRGSSRSRRTRHPVWRPRTLARRRRWGTAAAAWAGSTT